MFLNLSKYKIDKFICNYLFLYIMVILLWKLIINGNNLGLICLKYIRCFTILKKSRMWVKNKIGRLERSWNNWLFLFLRFSCNNGELKQLIQFSIFIQMRALIKYSWNMVSLMFYNIFLRQLDQVKLGIRKTRRAISSLMMLLLIFKDSLLIRKKWLVYDYYWMFYKYFLFRGLSYV